jgi:hypothetical protein
MSKMSLKKWKTISEDERAAYLRKGVVKVEEIAALLKDGDINDRDSLVVKHKATVRGILIAYGDSRDEAFSLAYQWMSDYKGELPEDRIAREEAEAEGLMALSDEAK